MSDIDIHHLAARVRAQWRRLHERGCVRGALSQLRRVPGRRSQFRSTLAVVAEAEAVALLTPADLKRRVMEEVAQTRQLSPRRCS